MSEVRCRRTINDGKVRCPWRGELEAVAAHAAETGHVGCLVCRWPLGDEDVRCCARCVNRVRDHLADIEDAFHALPSVAEATGYHSGSLPGGDALVLLGAGSRQGGGPDDHPRFRDPVPLLADLHTWEREWREEFGHDHYPRWRATVPTTLGYLRTWLWLAARTHNAVDDFMADIAELRDRALHVAGLADDPRSANANCTRCGGRLRRDYRPPTNTADQRITAARQLVDTFAEAVQRQRAAERTYEIPESALTRFPAPWRQREIVEPWLRGSEDEGLDDLAVCDGCRYTYTTAEYRIAQRIYAAANFEGWVTVAAAANMMERPEQTVWRWQRLGQITSACRVQDRRVVVSADEVRERAATTQRRKSQDELHRCA